MSLDIIEIALDNMSDHKDFEKLASEIMRDEGYPNIKPLGEVADEGADAVQESYYISEDVNRVVFQYTLQEYLPGKIVNTIIKLRKAGIDFNELVVVTSRVISTERQASMKRDMRKDHGISVNIFERKTLVNRLSKRENGIFVRHFADIRSQLEVFGSKKRTDYEDFSALERSLLSASIAFTFNEDAPRARKSVLDYLLLALISTATSKSMTIDDLNALYSKSVGNGKLEVSQIEASLERLVSQDLVVRNLQHFQSTEKARELMAGSTIKASEATSSLIMDVIEEMCKVSGKKISSSDQKNIAINTRGILVKLYRLFGIDMANHVLQQSGKSTITLDSYDEEILKTAKQNLPKEIGELLISVLSQILSNPSDEQALTLVNWSLAYLGAEIMNLDPNLAAFQAGRFKQKRFLLDTDFLLDCIVSECPSSAVRMGLVNALVSSGCEVTIPEDCINECIRHAQIAHRTYKYFSLKLFALSTSYVETKVGNVFVKGYYYAHTQGIISPHVKFENYLENYYDAKNANKFMAEVIKTRFPRSVRSMDPAALLNEAIPNDQLDDLSIALVTIISKSPKSEHRSPEEIKNLAKVDAQLFLSAYHLNNQSETANKGLFSGCCYLVTSSSKYRHGANRIGLLDEVSAHPSSLTALLELIGNISLSATEFVSLFENPLIIYAVNQSWDDVQALLDNGVTLADKSIPRLRADLDDAMHSQLISLQASESKTEASDEPAIEDEYVDHYVDFMRTLEARGYKRIPELDPLLKLLDKTKDEAKFNKQAYDELFAAYGELENLIEQFGKRKQRYLRRIVKKKK